MSGTTRAGRSASRPESREHWPANWPEKHSAQWRLPISSWSSGCSTLELRWDRLARSNDRPIEEREAGRHEGAELRVQLGSSAAPLGRRPRRSVGSMVRGRDKTGQ